MIMSHNDVSLSWPPNPPDMTKEAFGHILGDGLHGHPKISFLKDNPAEIYKGQLSTVEYRNHIAAGSCAVKINRKVLAIEESQQRSSSGNHQVRRNVYVWGFMMPREEVLDYKQHLPAETRRKICYDLIHLVHKLHSEFRIVHGDIKTPNILRCQDGTLRLCDFADSRMLDDEDWEGELTAEISSPRRNCYPGLPPNINDDLYSLGLTMWMLYSHQIPELPVEWLESGGHRIVAPININLITDEDIRERVRRYLALSKVIV